jgi:hypothetical protein
VIGLKRGPYRHTFSEGYMGSSQSLGDSVRG